MVALPRDFAQRLDAACAPRPPLQCAAGLRDAAVAVLLVPEESAPRDRDPRLVLIERTGSMRAHAGQVAFPGGKPDSADEELSQTALREASEEVGLPEADVIGRLAPVPTPSGFIIWPFVAWAPSGWEPFNNSHAEVAAVLTPRLSHLADPSVHAVTGRRHWRGVAFDMHEFSIHTPVVWGATARIVWDLLQRIRR